MRLYVTDSFLPWGRLDDCPSLETLRRVLRLIPDGELLDGLSRARGHGRNDYPVHVLWGVAISKIVLRHGSMESCLGEFVRNEALRGLFGIAGPEGVPKPWNMSRFQAVLGTEPHYTRLRRVFEEMIAALAEIVPDLGRHVAGDSSHLSARNGRAGGGAGAVLAPADGGRKERKDETGRVTEVLEWFGYKLHLLVDVKHEVAVSWTITPASAADCRALPEIVERAGAALPEGRTETLAYDRACDAEEAHRCLEEAGIRPVIRTRRLWKDEAERLLPGHPAGSNVVYDEAGTVYCWDVISDPPVRRPMAYIGHEPGPKSLKYRCPARHAGLPCPSEARCNAGRKYGRTVRVGREIDLRRFPPIPRATKTFERLYRGRTAVERVNGRLKVFWGADDGNVTGAGRFAANVGAVMVAHAALATALALAPRRGGALGRTRLADVTDALNGARRQARQRRRRAPRAKQTGAPLFSRRAAGAVRTGAPPP